MRQLQLNGKICKIVDIARNDKQLYSRILSWLIKREKGIVDLTDEQVYYKATHPRSRAYGEVEKELDGVPIIGLYEANHPEVVASMFEGNHAKFLAACEKHSVGRERTIPGYNPKRKR